MAINCEKVYSGTGDQIYPITIDKAVKISIKDTTLDVYLKELAESISKVQGADQVAKSLKFKIDYLATNTADVTRVKELEDQPETNQWGENFVLPSIKTPYTWKRTIVYFEGQNLKDGQKFYEIVTADIAEISQTLYMVKDNTDQVKVIYPQKVEEVSGELQNVDDTDASLDDIINANKESPNKWSKYPVEISASYPYGFMAVRSRSNGVWSSFRIALYSKWSYDSKLVTKFTVTSTSERPQLTRTEVNPGSQWVDTNTQEFTGYLWMISASQNNNNYILDSNKNIWSKPQLISIVR